MKLRVFFYLAVLGILAAAAWYVVQSVQQTTQQAVQPLQQALRAIPRSWLELAQTQGLNFKQTLLQVVLPASKGGMLVSAALVFAHTMGEFGAVLMVGGSIPGETKVASVALFELVEMQNGEAAWQLSLILLAIAFALLSLVYGTNRHLATIAG